MASERIITKVVWIMNFLLFNIFLKSSSKPIEKRRKYIPSWARKMKVVDDVMVANGLYADSPRPIRSGAKIQGILIFSRSRPIR